MSNFYGKRFLSSLVGALSVLSSPVASAVGGKLGKGNLKGKVGSSAGRSKNGGKGGKLEADRKVKSVNGLKEVLKETGGKVVRVSPDGKGGFVAFVKTPTGKVVTVAIVGVSLLAIITFLVFNGRKSNKGSEKIIDGVENEDEDKYKKVDLNEKKILNNDDEQPKIEGATVDLLSQLFDGRKDQYDSFVKKLFSDFFKDLGGVLEKKFNSCGGDLDKFLEVVFKESSFIDGQTWKVEGVFSGADVLWNSGGMMVVVGFNFSGFGSGLFNYIRNVFGYLYENSFVKFEVGCAEASWGDKISAILFSFWCLVKLGLDVGCGAEEVESKLKEQEIDKLSDTFNIIKSYVGERLKDVNRGYDGQELKKAKS